jgi:chemotaxis protein methyltransferase CheR
MSTLVETGPTLTDRDLQAIIRLVRDRSGISLHDGKRALVVARLQRRLRACGLTSFGDYVRRLERDRQGDELVCLIDAIATNHTSFFREPQHFVMLRERIVPDWLRRPGRPVLQGWSAACSSGEEPYTLAITLLEALAAQAHGRVRLLASDISTKVLAQARTGVFKADRVQGLSPDLLPRYFERGLGAQDGFVRVRQPVRDLIEFTRLNLISETPHGRQFDFIFCRNVMIYFDRLAQQQVVDMLVRHLVPGGYLFVSHAESLNGVTHRLEWVAPAVYRRGEA